MYKLEAFDAIKCVYCRPMWPYIQYTDIRVVSIECIYRAFVRKYSTLALAVQVLNFSLHNERNSTTLVIAIIVKIINVYNK